MIQECCTAVLKNDRSPGLQTLWLLWGTLEHNAHQEDTYTDGIWALSGFYLFCCMKDKIEGLHPGSIYT